jgi:hypothetical protein
MRRHRHRRSLAERVDVAAAGLWKPICLNRRAASVASAALAPFFQLSVHDRITTMSAAAILKLQASGFSADQVSALAELIDSQAATKADVEGMGHRLEQKIEASEHRLELKISDIKSDLNEFKASTKSHIESVEHRLELKMEVLERKIVETNSNTLKWVVGAIGFQTLVLIGTIIGAVSALMRFIPTTPITHQ